MCPNCLLGGFTTRLSGQLCMACQQTLTTQIASLYSVQVSFEIVAISEGVLANLNLPLHAIQPLKNSNLRISTS